MIHVHARVFINLLYALNLVAASLREVADLPDRLLELRPSKNVGTVRVAACGVHKYFSYYNNKSIARSNTSKTINARPDHRLRRCVWPNALTQEKQLLRKNKLSKNKIN